MKTASLIVCLIGIALASPIRKARDASSESMEGGNSDSDEMNPLVGQKFFLYPYRSQALIRPPPKYYPEIFPALPPKYSPYQRKHYGPFHSQYVMRYPHYSQQPFYSDYNKHLGPMYDNYPYNYHVFPLLKRIHNLAANRLRHHSTGSSFEASRESSPEVKSNSMENTRTEEHMEVDIPSVPSLDGIFMHIQPNDVPPHVSEHNAGLALFNGNYLSSEEVTDVEDPFDVLVNSDSKGVEHFRSFRADTSSEQVYHDITSSESADETLNNQELESQRVSRVDHEGWDIETETLQMTDSNSRGVSSESNTFESTEDGDENRAEQKTDLRAESIEDSTAGDSEGEDSKADLRNGVIDDDKTDSNDNYDNEYGKADLGLESTEDNSDESTEDDKDNSKTNLMVDSNEDNLARSIEDSDEDSKADLRVQSIEDNTSELNDDSDDEDSEADLRVHSIEDNTSESSDDEDNEADLRVESIEDNTSESSDDKDSTADLRVQSIEDNTSESNDNSDEDNEADLRVHSIEDNTSDFSDDSDEDNEAYLRVEFIEDNTSESNDDSKEEDRTADHRGQSIEVNTSESSDKEDNKADLRVHSIEDNTSEFSDDNDDKDSEVDLRVHSIEDNTSESSDEEDNEADLRVYSIEDSTSQSSDDSDDKDSEVDLRVHSIEDNTSESSDEEDNEADLRVYSIEDSTSQSSDDSDDKDSEVDLRVHSIEDNTSESSDEEDNEADLIVDSIEDSASQSNDDSDEDNEAELRVESIEDNTSESNDDSDDEDSTADQRARLIEDKASESTDDSEDEDSTAEDNTSETTDDSDNQAELHADSSAMKPDESNESDSNESNFVSRSLQEYPCNNHPCKRGKVCELDNEGMPMCVCQDISTCPPSTTDSQHVCGTNNQTYESSCQFFASKCIFEGTKKGHGLHLDYFGPCKDIAPCQDDELFRFPLRLRIWLKNVLVPMYERDLQIPGVLPEKQRNRVKKIYESEKNLHADDHILDLPYSDLKNSHSFIYPVHWQFRQLDQHPTDGYLSHSELAPFRAPLIPIEPCAFRFFTECNTDDDRFLSLREWAHCFDINEEDINPDLTY